MRKGEEEIWLRYWLILSKMKCGDGISLLLLKSSNGTARFNVPIRQMNR